MAHLHDNGYKYLFSHADLVRELLEVFAPPGVAELLNYATLRPETGHFITPAMKRREDDVVWSIELQGQRLYLYLLLEVSVLHRPGDAGTHDAICGSALRPSGAWQKH